MITFERTVRADMGGSNAPSAFPSDDGTTTRLDFPGTRRPNNWYSLRYQLDERCAFVRGTGWCLYVSSPTGLAIFTQLADLLAKAPALALATVLERLEDLRPLAYVAVDETAETIHFGRSLDGFASLYFGSNDERLVIADSALGVAKRLGPVRLSKHDEVIWCARNVLEPEGSFYEGVKRCFAGVRYQAGVDEGQPGHRRLMAPSARFSHHDAVARLDDGLAEMLGEYGNRRVALQLSGGMDSRTLLVALVAAIRKGILRKSQVFCTSVAFPGMDCDETHEIRHLIDWCGIEWINIQADAERVSKASEKLLELPMPPFPTSFMGMLCSEEAKLHGAEVVLSGHGGDEIFDLSLGDVTGLSLVARIRRIRLIRWLRRSGTLSAELKSLGVALLGRRAQRSLGRAMSGYKLSPHWRRAFRLETRLAIAANYGYEIAATMAMQRGMLTDVPFFRGAFWAELDPIGPIVSSPYPYKPVAQRYIQTFGDATCRIPTRKVAFDLAIRKFFPGPSSIGDVVDTTSPATYATRKCFVGWQSRQLTSQGQKNGHEFNEEGRLGPE
ncbi:MAG TPA: asparagine synthase-related protein [Rhodanobacteraceae bacterium]|nr:asparagine synthase-related protein [Rhodanobacteraceae bacterium]